MGIEGEEVTWNGVVWSWMRDMSMFCRAPRRRHPVPAPARWLSNTENREAAVKLAQSVVSARLAVGAQIVGPVGSVFWHQGEFGSGEEWQLVLRPGPVPVSRSLRAVRGES